MKYAAALYYGGELVSAIECSHADYIRLIPLCPECHEPVFYRVGSNGKRPAWCHFKEGKHSDHAACEHRVNSYSHSDKKKAATKARDQRLKLIQRWFSSCIAKNKSLQYERQVAIRVANSKNYTLAEALELARKYDHKYLEPMLDFLKKQYKGKDFLNNYIDGVWKMIDSGEHLYQNPSMYPNQQHLVLGTTPLDRRLHRQICFEVMGYLCSKKARLLLEQLFIIGNLSVSSKTQSKELNEFTNTVMVIHECISTTPWFSEIQRFEKEQAKNVG